MTLTRLKVCNINLLNLKGLSNLSYTERLAVLQLESLELWRLHFDLILTHKILFDCINTNKSHFFALKTNNATRGHAYKIQPSHGTVNAQQEAQLSPRDRAMRCVN